LAIQISTREVQEYFPQEARIEFLAESSDPIRKPHDQGAAGEAVVDLPLGSSNAEMEVF